VSPDLVPLLQKNKDVRVGNLDPLGQLGMIRFNFLQAPFNNQTMRQALLYAVNPHDYVLGVAGSEKNGRPCYSFFACGTPLSSELGSEALKGKRDLERAKKLIQDAGYKGEKIVVISASDQWVVHFQSLITVELLRKLGLNVELQESDWGTLITRRSSKEPVDKGGWSIFHTTWVAPDVSSPAAAPLVSSGDKAWFGWPTDKKLEDLREAWFNATDATAAKKAADEVQLEAFKFLPYIPTAQFISPTAYRSDLSGVIVSPVLFLWSVEKK